MGLVTVKLVKADSFKFYMNKDASGLARKLLDEGGYEVQGPIAMDLEGEEAAEEVFDLTNNPSRDLERLAIYGRRRSVSVGDIVNVDGVDFLCASVGWVKL